MDSLLQRFNEIGKTCSDTFAFWLEYCDMVTLLLDFLSAERDSDWNLHLETFQNMLNYDRAYDHYKYFLWGTIYIIDMLRLPEEHPELYEMYCNGFHTVSRAQKQSQFNSVSTDMALEQSMNRDSKTKGGIIGVSNDVQAVEKWTLTSHLRADILMRLKKICGLKDIDDLIISKKKTEDSEKAVHDIIEAIDQQFMNPFAFEKSEIKPLINIVSGRVVNDDMKDEILNANSIGKENAIKFIQERITEKTIPFWEPIKKLNLKTFSSADKPMQIKKKNETVILKNQQNIFSRLLSVSSARPIDLKGVFSHELSAIPLSLFHSTGEMRKTTKSQLLKELEGLVTSNTVLNNDNNNLSASIIDFMAVIQSTNLSGLTTFHELAERLEKSILSNFKESRVIALVPDRYDVISIKANERKRRQQSSSRMFVITHDTQKLPKNLQQFLSNADNKVNLINYLFKKWIASFSSKLQEGQIVYFANLDGTTMEVQKDHSNQVELKSDQEEADSKMLVYCKYLLCHPLTRIILSSPDTDVLVICCYHQTCCLTMLQEFWFKTGVANRRRYIPVHEISSNLGSSFTKMLPAFHTITGCDSVSSLNGVGKKGAFQSLKQNQDDILDLFEFGDNPVLDVSSPSTEACVRLVCSFYEKGNTYNINELRYRLFTQKSKSGEKLPPTLDALILHLKRACYQTFIWKSACQPILNLPSPVSNGWILKDEMLEPEFMLQPPVPENAIELVRCKCKKGCQNNSCSCRKIQLMCTDACLCDQNQECENVLEYSLSDDDVESD